MASISQNCGSEGSESSTLKNYMHVGKYHICQVTSVGNEVHLNKLSRSFQQHASVPQFRNL